MSYTLFITSNCHECEAVLKELNGVDLSIKILNIEEDNYKTPIPIFVYPAMFKDDLLIGYGSDILRYLRKKDKI